MCAKKADSPANRANKKPAGQAANEPSPGGSFYAVGIGSSAGGLEALEELFTSMPAEPGMAFTVVSHQHPGHVSLLPELLGRCTKMPVAEAQDGEALKPNRVYINPPGCPLGLMNGRFQLMDVPAGEQPSPLIDYFFRSLAEDQRERAICIVLSGTGTDGTLGLRAVKGELGMAMAQDTESARFTGMPASAIGTALTDYVLAPSAMPAQLLAYAAGAANLRPAFEEGGLDQKMEEPLQKIFMLLRSHTGHDFSAYKRSTLLRRIERRMTVHQIDDPGKYVRLLQESPHEIDLLFRELLIVVTRFFRDPEAFKLLRDEVLPKLLEKLPGPYTVRVWVPGCGSGEEAYTLAILLHEAVKASGKPLDVQVFATDLSADAVDFARMGRYPDGIASDVPPDLLKRHFAREDGFYRVREEIRKLLIFAQQNIIKDPPFTKLDLLSCRNLLIYLNAELQKRVLPIFHYALKPGGIMMLGPSETIGGQSDLFEPVNAKWKVFRRLEAPAAYRLPEMPMPAARGGAGTMRSGLPADPPPQKTLPAKLQALLLDRLVPPTVVVNNRGDILYIHGRTGTFLELRSGQPRMNIHEMARAGLNPALGSAMRQALAGKTEIHRERLRVKTNGDFETINLSVLPVTQPEPMAGLLMICFRPAEPAPSVRPSKAAKKGKENFGSRVKELEREVQYTRESLQSTVEELETSNEELKSANEELQSANEELQSTNEELETSKEELQSLNEELSTVNAEMESKVSELSHANDDMQNLLDNTHIATLFLDNELRIKRYTDQARQLIKLIPTDVGRPIGDLVSNLEYDQLAADARTVLETLTVHEQEVRTRAGKWYLLRIMPYRTAENLISGLVVTFVDIDKTKRLQETARRDIVYLKSIFDTFHEATLVLDKNLRIALANSTFYATFQTNAKRTEGQLIYDIGGGEWDIAELRRLLEEIVPETTVIHNYEVTREFPKIGRRTYLINARKLEPESGLPGMILLSMRQINP